MGIAPRTMTDQVTFLKGLWSVRTVAELTYQWALSPDRLVDDSPPVALSAVVDAAGTAA